MLRLQVRLSRCRGSFYEQNEFAFLMVRILFQPGCGFKEGTSVNFLKQFCDFACNENLSGGFENIGQRFEGFPDAVRSFVNNESCVDIFQIQQKLPTLNGPGRQKSDEQKMLVRKTAC